MNKQTKCVHSGTHVDPVTGGINTPIYTSSVFKYLDSDKQPYPRYFNTPNQEAVVVKLCALEQAEDGIVFSSGMAAISTAILSIVGSGDHVILQDELYGGTYALVAHQFERLGIGYSFVPKSVEAIEEAIIPETRLILIETPTNPLLGIIDIEQVAVLARKHSITTMIDNTFASPINQNPLLLGIDIVVHSGTKYIGGHSDICCGAVLTSREFAGPMKMTAMDFGGSLNAATCALVERSLKTLHLRVSKQSENALAIAYRLSEHDKIEQVFYPGLPTHPNHDIAASQMSGFGGMVGFTLADSAGSSHEFLKRLELIVPALSLGGIESTICAPAETSHKKMTREARERIGVTERLMRLSVGIEHFEDLLDDLVQALDG
jgi:cystathionine beta-lyase